MYFTKAKVAVDNCVLGLLRRTNLPGAVLAVLDLAQRCSLADPYISSMSRLLTLLLIPILCTCDLAKNNICEGEAAGADFRTWAHYGGDHGLNHFSSSTVIDTNNVGDLRPVWTYHTGDANPGASSQIQTNPIVLDGTLYGVSPAMKLFAIDAATGEHRWTFDPDDAALEQNGSEYKHAMINVRGITHWVGSDHTRLFFTAGSHTYAVDAATGRVITEFGDGGHIDLHDNLGRDVSNNFIVSTSPGMVYRDKLIMGTRVDETLPAAPGHVRAYNVRTGELEWIFHTLPQPGEPGFETWENPEAYKYTGGANVWSGFSLDEERGVVYCGTGSPSYDFYGANRPGTNLYANCILALNAETGERVWHYQTVHHDLWDKDHPTPPVLVTVTHDGERVDAVAQPTKNGDLFLLNRDTGEPLFPVEERPVPTEGAFAEEYVHPTQPRPTLPKPFSRQTLTVDDINPYMDADNQAMAREVFATSRYGDPYLPPGPKRVIFFPGMDGGAEWGGPAVDPRKGVMYINSNHLARFIEMVPNEQPIVGPETMVAAGERLYRTHCQSCHHYDRSGHGDYPSLVNIGERYDETAFTAIVHQGRRMMPAFGHLAPEQVEALATYVLELPDNAELPYAGEPEPAADAAPHLPYKLKGYTKFLSSNGMPAISPPWGTLTAVDLNSGEHLWNVPLGEYEHYKAAGIPATGTENYGGPAVTAGGLVFIAATSDRKFRAFHQRTGAVVWEVDLPAAGFATPSIYELDGRAFVVIACGGGKLGAGSGDAYVAYSF